ncbi:glutamate--cysteine ligase [Sporobolomyces salmoneus]|uniref:glutamate--cysteine ligase n=1 Tax=Sporobolomyces salmoneus TaxID=183962 RepID=UPI00316F7B47
MGLLALGTPLPWSEAKKHADYVREHGIEQFLSIWEKLKDRTGDRLMWGDEIEYMIISYDDEDKNARLSLRQEEILADLHSDAAKRKEGNPGKSGCIPVFHPEYGRYMLESTPGEPYGATLEDLLLVEGNMRFRRKLAQSRMKPNEVPVTLTSFPRLGAPGVFTDPYHKPGGGVARSLFLPDEVINQHVRFPTLTANIRRRRGSKVAINMPIYVDENTPRPFVDPTVPRDRNDWPEDANAREGAALDDHIYLDAMGFGMGCCCLQITFQACSVGEARRMYDAFVPVGPIMLALTAASPIFRGLLSDVDCRWDVIAGSVDDRTPQERGLEPLMRERFVIPKSRYDSVDCYIADSPYNRPEYNDNNMPIDESIRDTLIERGVDKLLATHFAHLFIRDPIVIFEETMCQDDEKSSDHFENIQSTNWQTVRFKPPPPGSPIGWRVEFRSMEVQLTDYENAAFAVFIVLLTRAIMSMGLNFYLPISKVDENMHRAHRRDAVNSQKFYFRKNLFDPKPGRGCDPSLDTPLPTQPTPTANGNGHSRSSTSDSSDSSDPPTSPCCSSHAPSRAPSPLPRDEESQFGPIEDEYDEFTINEIINGSPSRSFPGLLGVVRQYLDRLQISPNVRTNLEKSLDLVSKRADGSLITTATWMRNFVKSHPAYKHDSVVSKEINYDLVRAVDRIEKGQLEVPELLPQGWRENYVKSKDSFSKCCGDAVNGLEGEEEEEDDPALQHGAVVDVDCGIALGRVVEAAK